MPIIDDAAAHSRRDHRCLQHLGDLEQLFAGVHRASTGDDQRPVRRRQQLCRLFQSIRIRLGIGARLDRIPQTHLRGDPQQVHRHLDLHRATHAAGELFEGLPDHVGNARRVINTCGPLGERRNQSELVGNFVQQPESLTDRPRRYLPGHREHRRVAPVRSRERGRGVEQSRARHHRVHADPPTGLRVTEGHVTARLLMACVENAN